MSSFARTMLRRCFQPALAVPSAPLQLRRGPIFPKSGTSAFGFHLFAHFDQSLSLLKATSSFRLRFAVTTLAVQGCPWADMRAWAWTNGAEPFAKHSFESTLFSIKHRVK